MHSLRTPLRLARFVPCSMLLALFLFSSCRSKPPVDPPPSSTVFVVHQVTLGIPSWLPPAKYNYKLCLSVVFTQSVDVNTLKMPGTVNMAYECLGSNRKATNVAGIYYPSPDKKTIVFVSNKTGTELGVSPGGGEDTEYKLILVGTDAGAGTIKNTAGKTLDGDNNGTPGGNHVWSSGHIVG